MKLKKPDHLDTKGKGKPTKTDKRQQLLALGHALIGNVEENECCTDSKCENCENKPGFQELNKAAINAVIIFLKDAGAFDENEDENNENKEPFDGNKTLIALDQFLREEIVSRHRDTKINSEIVEELAAFKPNHVEEIAKTNARLQSQLTALEPRFKEALAEGQAQLAKLAAINLQSFLAATKKLAEFQTKVSELAKAENISDMHATYLCLQNIHEGVTNASLRGILNTITENESLTIIREDIRRTLSKLSAQKQEYREVRESDPNYGLKKIAAKMVNINVVCHYIGEFEASKGIRESQATIDETRPQLEEALESKKAAEIEKQELEEEYKRIKQRLRELSKGIWELEREVIPSMNKKIDEAQKKISSAEEKNSKRKSPLLSTKATSTKEEPSELESVLIGEDEETEELKLESKQERDIQKLFKKVQEECPEKREDIEETLEFIKAAAQDELKQKGFNTLISYFIVYEGNVEKIKEGLSFHPQLSSFLETYFPEATNEEVQETQDIVSDFKESIEILNGYSLALVCHEKSNYTASFIKKVKEELEENGIECNITHVCSSTPNKVRNLYDSGKIDCVIMHYDYCRPPDISKIKRACRKSINGDVNRKRGEVFEKIPQMLVPYMTSPKLTLRFIAERSGRFTGEK